MREIDYHLCRQPLTAVMEECGETGTVMLRSRECVLALVDALGHSSQAHEVAVLTEEYLMDLGDEGQPSSSGERSRTENDDASCIALR